MKKQTVYKIIVVAAIVVFGLLGMNFLGSDQKESNKREIVEKVRAVEVQNIAFGQLTLEIEGHGVIHSRNSLGIVSEVSGRIEYAKNNLKSGTFVNKGELILKIDSRETRNNLLSLRSDFLNALAGVLPDLKIDNSETYEKWYKYFQSIDIEEIIPELPHMTNSSEKIKISSRNILTKYYSVKNQEILLSKYEIIAPFEGYLKSGGLMENSFVAPGMELFKLEDVVNLEIAVPLLKEELAMINASGRSEVRVYPDENSGHYLTGYIERTDKILDKNSQTINSYVALKNFSRDAYFLPGNYVRVVIDGRRLDNVASIPRHTLDENNHIYVMEDGKLGRMEVDIVTFQKDQVIIRKTIPENTKLVTTILQKALIGMPLREFGSGPEMEVLAGEGSDPVGSSN